MTESRQPGEIVRGWKYASTIMGPLTKTTDDLLLTARQVGERLGVSTETVLRWTRSGDLPAIRLPSNALRYRESDLNRWLSDRNTQQGGGADAR